MSTQEALRVSDAEAEQKIMAFLARRIDAPNSLLHKWIRSGQVRVNGLRVKPFHRIAFDDLVRIPPFAVLRKTDIAREKLATKASADLPCFSLPPIIYEDKDILLLHKPEGLPVHPGTGHTDSASTRLAKHYEHCAFVPTPAHRLDKATSGLLVVGKSYKGLRAMQDLFARRVSTQAMILEKTYLAWLCGSCPWDVPTIIEHRLCKIAHGAYERVAENEQGQEARLEVACIRKIVSFRKSYSLVRVQLLTGRTHQIRAQMSIMGFPVMGDKRYGGMAFSSVLLHAYRLVLPQGTFIALPDWPLPFSMNEHL